MGSSLFEGEAREVDKPDLRDRRQLQLGGRGADRLGGARRGAFGVAFGRRFCRRGAFAGGIGRRGALTVDRWRRRFGDRRRRRRCARRPLGPATLDREGAGGACATTAGGATVAREGAAPRAISASTWASVPGASVLAGAGPMTAPAAKPTPSISTTRAAHADRDGSRGPCRRSRGTSLAVWFVAFVFIARRTIGPSLPVRRTGRRGAPLRRLPDKMSISDRACELMVG